MNETRLNKLACPIANEFGLWDLCQMGRIEKGETFPPRLVREPRQARFEQKAFGPQLRGFVRNKQ